MPGTPSGTWGSPGDPRPHATYWVLRSQPDRHNEGDPTYTTTFEYDQADRQTRITHPDGEERLASFGLWQATATDENGKSATTRLDAFGRTVESEATSNSLPVVTSYSYDLLGRMTGIEDARGNIWSYTFDTLGRTTQEDDPDAGVWSAEYDDAGRVTALVDAKNQRSELAYDLAGRLSTRTVIGTPNRVTTITRSQARSGYFNNGRVTTVTAPDDVLTSDYDAQGRILKQVRTFESVNYTVEGRFDSAGRPQGTTYPDGDVIGSASNPLTYDSAGRLSTIPGILNGMTYDAAGQPLVQTNVNGTQTTRSYDPERGFLTSIATLYASTTIQNLTYTPDLAGMVTGVTSPFPNESWTYSYDDLYQLTQATNTGTPGESQSFTYDDLGRISYNSRMGNYTYPADGAPRPHAPLAAGSNSYSYDPNGNMYSGAGRTITWDKENQITLVTLGPTTTSFVYDAGGDRLKKTSGGTTSLYPFGDDYEVTAGTITKYIAAPGVGVVAKKVGTTLYWLHADRLGSIQAISDGAGAVLQRRTYRPYGDKIADSTGHVESRGWIEQRQETGVTFLHARYYDPALGAFLSPDPAGADLNAYAYSYGDPINLSDPSGLNPWVLCMDQYGAPCGQSPPSFPGGVSVPGGGGPIGFLVGILDSIGDFFFGSNPFTRQPYGSESNPVAPSLNGGKFGSGDMLDPVVRPNTGSNPVHNNTAPGPGPQTPLDPIVDVIIPPVIPGGGGTGGGGGGNGGGTGRGNGQTNSEPLDIVLGQRLGAFWDGALPLLDPFKQIWSNCWECGASFTVGEVTGDIELTLLGNGVVSGAARAGLAPSLLGRQGRLLGWRGRGVLNNNDYLRWGWGRDGAREIIRIGIGSKRTPRVYRHIRTWPPF